MTAYYNENDPRIAAWLRELIKAGLIAPGDVDERSIEDVRGTDLAGYDQCHFFAGIGGWSYALRLAGWPDDRSVWTGSCPCQPFSAAGKRKGTADERHLWPHMHRLIAECRPSIVFGEQVEGAVRHGWLDGVFADLEATDYACGAVVLGAHSVGAPHIRQRLFWVADRNLEGGDQRSSPACRLADAQRDATESRGIAIQSTESSGAAAERSHAEPRRCGPACGMEHPAGDGRDARGTESVGRGIAGGCGGSGLRHAVRTGLEAVGVEQAGIGSAGKPGFWSDYILIPCADGKARRLKPGIEPLAHGISARVVRLCGYGNAIVPQVAAEFIEAYREASLAAGSGTKPNQNDSAERHPIRRGWQPQKHIAGKGD